MMRTDCERNAAGTRLLGWYYRLARTAKDVPVTEMAQGWSAAKAMDLDPFAEQFAAAGLAIVMFDHRNFGPSESQPRQEIGPWAQVRDNRHAITWVQAQSKIHPCRIGIWGASYFGWEVLVVDAMVPTADTYKCFTQRQKSGDRLGATRRRCAQSRGGPHSKQAALSHGEVRHRGRGSSERAIIWWSPTELLVPVTRH